MKKKRNGRVLQVINFLLVLLIIILILTIISDKNPEMLDEEFYVKVIDSTENRGFYAVCFSWTQCSPNNTLSRKCYPLDNLSKELIQTKACNYEEVIHCGNGVKDFDETDVDCGGSCKSCELFQRCKVNNDCKSANCHPVTKECVNHEEMPNFMIRLIFAHPVLMFSLIVILPATIMYLWWLKSSLDEDRIKTLQKNKELVLQFQEYSKMFRDNVKNGNPRIAKDVFLEINRILSEMDDDALKKVLKEYKSLKKIYTQINKSNEEF